MKKKNNNKVERTSDSLLTHFFVRPLSSIIATKLKKTFVRPMHVILLGLFVAIAASAFGSIPKWSFCVLAAILFEVSHLLDCVDGELARLTNRVDDFGASIDAIADRIKDGAVIYASYLQALYSNIFNLSDFQISSIAVLSIGAWFIYIYIVDAHLIPANKRAIEKTNEKIENKIYLGLYDLFIYGAILLWLFNRFEYFIIWISGISLMGVIIQIIRLKHACGIK